MTARAGTREATCWDVKNRQIDQMRAPRESNPTVDVDRRHDTVTGSLEMMPSTDNTHVVSQCGLGGQRWASRSRGAVCPGTLPISASPSRVASPSPSAPPKAVATGGHFAALTAFQPPFPYYSGLLKDPHGVWSTTLFGRLPSLDAPMGAGSWQLTCCNYCSGTGRDRAGRASHRIAAQ